MVALTAAQLVFWDFDGVIKESVEVKADAFERLFLPFGAAIAQRVRHHHEANGGMSRFDKLPIYLGWAGEPATPEQVDLFCRRFGDQVRQAVIDAPWVPGVEVYLRTHCDTQMFVLVSATPRDELTAITDALALTGCFREIHGAPESKTAAVGDVLARTGCRPDQALFVGDADADFSAANANRVPFLLRRTPLNRNLQARHRGPSFATLADECGAPAS